MRYIIIKNKNHIEELRHQFNLKTCYIKEKDSKMMMLKMGDVVKVYLKLKKNK